MKLYRTLLIASLTFAAAQVLTPAAQARPPQHTFRYRNQRFFARWRADSKFAAVKFMRPRVPREYWRHRLQMAKAMGLNNVLRVLILESN